MTERRRTARQVPNTLGVPCLADEVRVVTSIEGLTESLDEADRRGLPVTVVAGGSNLVLRSRLPGLVLLLSIRGIQFERLGANRWRVTAGAGENWHALVCATLERGIGGLENLALIPGSVGAAPVQNIGAYGRELAEVVESVRVLDRATGELRTHTADACGFGYRESVFKRSADRIIVAVTLVLGDVPLAAEYPDVKDELQRLGVVPSPRAVADAVMRVRRRKLPDPGRIGNVGSFFKNPFLTPAEYDQLRSRLAIDGYPADGQVRVKVPAARLIDAAGWKGAAEGPVQVWPRQPLVLVNRGGATGAQVLALAERIRADIATKYDVGLALEPTVLGVPYG